MLDHCLGAEQTVTAPAHERSRECVGPAAPLLIYQPRLMHYRVWVFNRLQRALSRRVIVVHGGEMVGSPCEFVEVQDRQQRWGPFLSSKRFFEVVPRAWAILTVFDPHHLPTVHSSLRFPDRTVLWGIGRGRGRVGNMMRAIMARRVSAIALYTERDEGYFRRYGARKITRAPNTVPVGYSGCISHTRRDKLLFVGSLTDRKRLDLLLLALSEAKEKGGKVPELWVVGDGAARGSLGQLARDLGLQEGHLRWFGQVENQEALTAIYSRALAVISPGQVGLTVLQSFGHGVPVVTFDTAHSGGELQHVIHGTTGLRVQEGIHDLASFLCKTEDLRGHLMRMGTAARERYLTVANPDLMLQGLLDALRATESR